MSDNRTLRAALWYAQHGWSVFPIHAPLFDIQGTCYACTCEDWRRSEECKALKPHLWLAHGEHCKQPGKCPACRWAEKSTTDSEQIQKWWGHEWRTKLEDGYSTYYMPNIGIDCGKSNLLTLDVDTYKNLYGDIDDLLPIKDRQTVTAISGGGGEHLVYNRLGKPYGNSTKGLPPGIDIRGAGGYIVAAPSIHKTNRRYRWEMGYGPHEMNPAPIPFALRSILDKATHHRMNHQAGEPSIEAVKKSSNLVEQVLRQTKIEHKGQQEYGQGRRWILPKCPFNPVTDPHGDDGGTFVIVLEDGFIAAGCHHNRCRHVIEASGLGGWNLIMSKIVLVSSLTSSKYPRVYTVGKAA